MPYWTEEERFFLKQNYKKIDTNKIAKKLNRSASTVRAQALLLGIATSKQSFKILPGTVFGRLRVIEEVNRKTRDGSNKYLCQCCCGTVKEIRRSSLITGDSQSCGCLTSDRVRETHALPDGETSFNSLYTTCKRSANRKSRTLEFSLTPKQHKDIVIQKCFYCGAEPTRFSRYETKIRSDKKKNIQIHITSVAVDRSWIYVNTVDRLDSNKGYTIDNCVPACYGCNIMKMDSTEKDFIDQAYKIVEFQEKKKNDRN
jgi:hypothetical protein